MVNTSVDELKEEIMKELDKYLIPDLAKIVHEYYELHCEYCNNKIWQTKYHICRNHFDDCHVICGKCNYNEIKSIKSYERRRDWAGYMCSLCKNPPKGRLKKNLLKKMA
jgi:hypothetical protein